MPAHSVQFHFFFFFLKKNLITVGYFKAQTVEVDLGTLAGAGGDAREQACCSQAACGSKK